MKKFRFLFSFCLLLFSFLQSYAQDEAYSSDINENPEKIKQFHTDIFLKENGNIIVTETIKVYAKGEQIDHGIFRELPLISNSSKVSKNTFYTVLNVTKDHYKEPYHIDEDSETFKIYIGDKDHMLSEGTYTYQLTYEVEAQIHSYDEFDEIYWNVTGNYWQFEIENVTAKITFPKGAKAFQTYCYTGILGSKAHECDAKIIGNCVYFTSKNLKKEEGFTIAAGFPKGIIHQPFFSPHYKLEEFLAPDKILLAIAFVSICFAFYYFSWKRYGEDPLLKDENSKIDLKNLYSPASLYYLKERYVSTQTLLIAIINLSMKGAIQISDNGKENWADEFQYTLKKTNATTDLTKEENTVLEALFEENDSFVIDNKTYSIFNKAKYVLQESLESQYNLKNYFSSNYKQILLGFAITISALLGYCHLAKGTIFWAAISGFMFLIFNILIIKSLFKAIIKVNVGGILICLFLLVFTGVFCFGSFFAINVDKSYSILNLLVLFTIISGFSIYLSLISAYTELGIETKSQIKKLKQYLLDYKPEENATAIRIYEENLPYAFALGIEEEWNKNFIDILKRLNYTNNWIKTTNTSSGFSIKLITNFSSTYNTFSSSSGSGSSGGGSSGGGGGGGGGGGW
ncbi:DUF2207 domain-containing protein [Flavobacterium branchiicola]|uniref:DUF2207 domain-containing protein n=1 Tax=Flavobacterium branchiicola TaxID=1114875 RepID=A0ABV9PNL9_9FLAO|nr:DUF2207 domain-containing protein [Flavobacterium branchiicola]MBS7256693.1 DUF2207 domain-containing protein [Flavobacterium branchiicola]